MKVLAVGAHPDDLEILCGGTLRRCVERGDHVVMCHASRGDRGAFARSRDEVASVRFQEAGAAAAIAGAAHVCLGFSDAEIDASDRDQRTAVVDLVREHRPELIITHGPSDYMGDHNEISRLVFECSFHATLPLLESKRPAHDVVAALYYMDTLAGVGFVPSDYVDVSAAIEVKRQMLEAHVSQLAWLRAHDGVDVVADMLTATRYRGMQCGVAYAEGFKACRAWLRQTPRRVLP
jgi:LmbE family N-acetylglucosaminyl deacetylase